MQTRQDAVRRARALRDAGFSEMLVFAALDAQGFSWDDCRDAVAALSEQPANICPTVALDAEVAP